MVRACCLASVAALLVCASVASAAGPRSEPLRARTNGFLTRPSDERPATVALDYVRAHPGAFELDSGDIDGLRLARSYRAGGIAHLQWEQLYRGIPVFGPGLRANVAADGRLINVGEGAVPDPGVESIKPRLSAAEAVRASGMPGAVGRASLTLFGGHRLAWRVLLRADATHVYDAVVDANTGERLYRVNLVKEAVTAHVFTNYPGASSGGVQEDADITPWLGSATTLTGNFAHVYSDPGDDIDGIAPDPAVQGGDEIPPSTAAGPGTPAEWIYDQQVQLTPTDPGQHCPAVGCSWNNYDGSLPWTANREQAGTQLFYYVNTFHDHLRDAAGIGFGAGSGNFEGVDAVQAQVDDGASTFSSLFPACSPNYTNNAYALPVPDGQPLFLQFYLWSSVCTGGSEYDVNPVDDALIVYHEYTHGMTNRLVTDAGGSPAMNGAQAGAMDEGLADFFALDFLVADGKEADTVAPGELRAGRYENDPLRSQAWDCPVGAAASACPGAGTAGSGGYTYGDFGRILAGPEVHADGEIWVETLWDLRAAEIAAHGVSGGLTRTRALVTDGLRLAPANPTFLGLRNAILQADVAHGYGDSARIWAVFARRGMGYYATTTGSDDTNPVQSFSLPPAQRVAPPPPPPDRTRPAVSGTSLTKRRIKVGARTAFQFTLSEVATVEIGFARAESGRRSKGRCRAATRKLRKRPRCTRYVARGSLVKINMSAGAHSVGFSGKLRGRALPTGAYKVTIRATDPAGNRSRPVTTTLRIVRR